jgi:hypothetical protein
MRVTATFRFLADRSLPWLTLFEPPTGAGCTRAALADASKCAVRLVVALTLRELACVSASSPVLL